MIVLLRAHEGHPPHYDRVAAELAADDQDKVMPTRVHAIVLVSKLHKPTLRALAFAKATRPNTLEASTSTSTPKRTDRLLEEWDERGIDVPLKVLDSPYREITADRRLRRAIRRPTRAASSRSTSRSTSSAAGGSSCCTTRPRCGSRAGCCSPRA
jgi:arylamine N-acetyltransferase